MPDDTDDEDANNNRPMMLTMVMMATIVKMLMGANVMLAMTASTMAMGMIRSMTTTMSMVADGGYDGLGGAVPLLMVAVMVVMVTVIDDDGRDGALMLKCSHNPHRHHTRSQKARARPSVRKQ